MIFGGHPFDHDLEWLIPLFNIDPIPSPWRTCILVEEGDGSGTAKTMNNCMETKDFHVKKYINVYV